MSGKATLTDLPAELIQRIHLLAHNPFFPQAARNVHLSLHNPSAYYAATYLLSLYEDYGPNEILVRSVRHPVCDVETAKEIMKIWDRRRGYVDPATLPASSNRNNTALGSDTASDNPINSLESDRSLRRRSRSRSRSRSPTPPPPLPPPPSAPALTCSELPRRLFRDPPSKSDPIHPLIRYLFTSYAPSANSHKGYPLFRAILTTNYELVSYLLQYGADPGIRDCFALEIAISLKDLKMVKLLVERNPTGPGPGCVLGAGARAWPGPGPGPGPGQSTPSPVKTGKKVKLNDRVEIGTRMVQKAIEKGSKDIINYFVLEKKVMPPLQSIMSLGKPERVTPNSIKQRKRPRSSLK
ncbi:hypothetical protein IAT40_003621 [Kwoniella sp. CBS 6097]